jgi:transcriptional regulator
VPSPRIILPLDNRQEHAYALVDYQGENMAKPTDLLQGTLDLLILRVVALEPLHGWGIAQRIRQISGDVLQVRQGTLYPALHRLERQGWVRAKWADSENNRKAKYYSLTREGRKYLESEQTNWERLSVAINLVLGAAGATGTPGE